MRTRAGFTLLEVMLATFVLALVVAMVTASLSGSLKVIDSTRQEGDLYYRAQVALQRIRADLQAAILLQGVEFIGQEQQEASLAGDQLSFTSLSHLLFEPDTGQPGPGIIRYTVRPEKEDSQRLVLLRSDRLYRPGEEADQEDETPFVLCDGLRSVRFRYIDAQGEEHESWTTKTDAPGKPRLLPAAVSCTLEFWLDQEAETTLSMEISVVLPAGLYGRKEKERG